MKIEDIRKLDLHMHSRVSDGTDEPEEILAKAREAGLDLFALSDHDAYMGCERIVKARVEGDPHFLTGIEFSCRDEGGKYHILGYGYDPDAAAIRAVVEKGHGFRMEKLKGRLDFLKEEYGFDFSPEDVRGLFALSNPGKPHIANLMVKYGYVGSKEEGIREFLNKKRFPTVYVRPEEAIRGILESGGIPVLAHPVYGSGEELILGEELRERLAHLLAFGLQGLEAYYSGFTKRMQAETLSLAEEFGLYVTAGSDYHGKNKLVILGDTNLNDAADAAPGLARFLEAVRDKIY